MIYTLVFLLALASGVLYRFGGWGNEGREKFPNLPEWLFNTKARDLGCPVMAFLAMLLLVKAPWWVHFLAFGALFGCLTTYWDFLFGYDHFPFHGFMCGVAYFPYIFSGDWIGFLIRCACLTLGFWILDSINIKKNNDIKDEFGRGFILVITLFIFLIGA